MGHGTGKRIWDSEEGKGKAMDVRMEGYAGQDLVDFAAGHCARHVFNADMREDAMQEFCLAALAAAEKADPEKGVKAYQGACGAGAVKNFLSREKSAREMRPRNPSKARREKAEEENDTGSLKMSLSAGVYIGGEMWERIDLIPNRKSVNPLDAACRSERKQRAREVVKTLPKKLEAVIRMRYFENQTLDEVGKTFGYGKERARQVEETALALLRKAM